MLYCFIQNVNIATLHYIGSAQCYIALCRTFIVLYCLYSVHSATLPYTEWSYCYISFYRTFVVLLCIIQDVHSIMFMSTAAVQSALHGAAMPAGCYT
jgi:hypothetical protein